MGRCFLVAGAIALLVVRKLVGDEFLELEDRGVAVDIDWEALPVLLAGLIHVDEIQRQLFGWLQARVGADIPEAIFFRVLDEHLDVLETPLDTLFLDGKNLLVAEGPNFFVALIEGGLFIGIAILNEQHVALNIRDATEEELVFKF